MLSMSVVWYRLLVSQRKDYQMTTYEMKMRYKELMRIAESDTMLPSEFDELQALFVKLNK
jgi:hypothetical protein